MNRIILIGNGFDLAHGLETKYSQFIDDYWKGFKVKITEARGGGFENVFVKIANIPGVDYSCKNYKDVISIF